MDGEDPLFIRIDSLSLLHYMCVALLQIAMNRNTNAQYTIFSSNSGEITHKNRAKHYCSFFFTIFYCQLSTLRPFPTNRYEHLFPLCTRTNQYIPINQSNATILVLLLTFLSNTSFAFKYIFFKRIHCSVPLAKEPP